jgi:hypothetical protein
MPSFAIISDINVNNTDTTENNSSRFSVGPETIRKICLIPDEEPGEVFLADSQMVAQIAEDIACENIEPEVDNSDERVKQFIEKELLSYITERHGDIGFTMEGLTEGQLYLEKDNNTYCVMVVISSSGWFKRSVFISARLGTYYTMPVAEDYSIATPRVEELKSMLDSVVQEKRDILAESCSFQSEAAELSRENKFLQSMLDRFHAEIKSLNEKHDEAQSETINRINNLETKIMYNKSAQSEFFSESKKVSKSEPRFGDDVIGKFENSLALLTNFDKSKLRSIAAVKF